jgi:hypothetical protein
LSWKRDAILAPAIGGTVNRFAVELEKRQPLGGSELV